MIRGGIGSPGATRPPINGAVSRGFRIATGYGMAGLDAIA